MKIEMTKQIENYIEENLTGDARKNALKFVKFLRANEMQFIKDNGYWKDKIYYLIEYNDDLWAFGYNNQNSRW